MSSREIAGVVRLPRQILVAEGALGATFAGQLESADVELLLPRLPSDAGEDSHVLESPLPDINLRGEDWGREGYGRNADFPRPLASWVNAFGFRATVSVDSSVKPEDLAYQFGAKLLDPWLEVVLQWVELWTNLNLTVDENGPLRTDGSFWDMSCDPPQLTGWMPTHTVYMHASSEAMTEPIFRAAVSRASAGESPPIQWLLHLRARRLVDWRQAVIAAAMAAEVALSQAVEARLHGLSTEAQDLIVRDANGVVGLVALLEKLDGTTPSSRNRVMHRLAGPRNRAAHAGTSPTQEELISVLSESQRLLDQYTPLPGP